LSGDQQFHLIFFGGAGKPLELKSKRLVPATREHKDEVAEFLETVIPEHETLVLPALERAFEVLKDVDPSRRALICLLSDGAFEGFAGGTNEYKGLTGNKAVVKLLDDRNKKVQYRDANGQLTEGREVQINTFLYLGRDPKAIEVMEEIAKMHDGDFTHVTGY
jgi:hypothetical protein